MITWSGQGRRKGLNSPCPCHHLSSFSPRRDLRGPAVTPRAAAQLRELVSRTRQRTALHRRRLLEGDVGSSREESPRAGEHRPPGACGRKPGAHGISGVLAWGPPEADSETVTSARTGDIEVIQESEGAGGARRGLGQHRGGREGSLRRVRAHAEPPVGGTGCRSVRGLRPCWARG